MQDKKSSQFCCLRESFVLSIKLKVLIMFFLFLFVEDIPLNFLRVL